MSAETMTFQAETARLLHFAANALYSNKEVFIRELVSNSADACDKLRFLSQSDASLMSGEDELKVTVSLDEEAGTLTFADTGIGMTREELIENLGTIADLAPPPLLKICRQQTRPVMKAQPARSLDNLGLVFIPRSWWPTVYK